MKLCVVLLNYRRADLTIDCLRTLVGEIAPHPDRCVCVVDNNSGDGSADRIETTIQQSCWSRWARVARSPVNGGFAAGNNVGFKAVDAEAYLVLNSDTHMLPGSITRLLDTMEQHPDAGLIGPRLQGPDGTLQISCFRYRSPIGEMLSAAGTAALSRLFKRAIVAIDPPPHGFQPQWLSFACVLIRREVLQQVGLMDEQYFMYFEDIDYARRVRRAGWKIWYEPSAAVVHLRGGSSSVKSAMKSRRRVPKYYYEARSRYFAKHYGGAIGLWMTNVLWTVGRMVALAREIAGNKKPHACAHEFRDNWTNWLAPMRAPTPPGGGDL
jgi:GT2 family glycosyltransferase